MSRARSPLLSPIRYVPTCIRPFIFGRIAAGLGRQLEGALGDLVLGQAGPAVEILNRPAVPVARGEIHPGIDAGGILPQRLLHPAEPLEAFLPIEQGELAQAGKGIPDGDLILRLAVLLPQAEIVQGFVEGALQPALHRRQRGPFVIEVIDQLRGEIGARAGLGFGQFRHESRRAGWDLAGWP